MKKQATWVRFFIKTNKPRNKAKKNVKKNGKKDVKNRG
jgi:hypothetical protein